MPHAGCDCPRCRRHRTDPLLPACLGLVGERASYLIDATPALPAQLAALPGKLGGVLLTHLHMGHVAGLLQFGPEALATRGLAVHATPAVCAFLRRHGPWELLVRRNHIAPVEHAPGERFELEPEIAVEPLPVPHRDEYADTVGWLVSGPRRRLLYLPDIDDWGEALPGWLDRCDLALLDGTFYAPGEIARQERVPHPPVTRTLDLLDPERAAKVRFLHFNHTNPLLDEAGPAAPVAWQGMEIPLGPAPA